MRWNVALIKKIAFGGIPQHVRGSTSDDRICCRVFDFSQCRSLPERVCDPNDLLPLSLCSTTIFIACHCFCLLIKRFYTRIFFNCKANINFWLCFNLLCVIDITAVIIFSQSLSTEMAYYTNVIAVTWFIDRACSLYVRFLLKCINQPIFSHRNIFLNMPEWL